MLGKALLFVAIPFVLTTLYFGTRGGYYDSNDYNGCGLTILPFAGIMHIHRVPKSDGKNLH